MKIRNFNNPLVWLMMLLVSSCVEPYFPEVLGSPSSFLVVNGFLNADGPTNIQLLRTQNIDDMGLPPAESNANLAVESETGERFSLQETGNGNYTHPNLQLNTDRKYRLHIRTRNGKEYLSEYVEVKATPAIGEVQWRAVNDEVKVYVNTQDANNATKYYKWDYEETWQFRSAFFTNLKFENDKVQLREPSDALIYNCWRSQSSSTIELGSSSKLNEDVISNYNLLSLPYNAEKIGVKYSVLVKQYALTREAYEYWEMVKKNTESIGTLFDPLPSQINSNIKSQSDPNEQVIGFVTAASVQTKRLFIDSQDLPRGWRLYSLRCMEDTVYISSKEVEDRFRGGEVLPVSEVYVDNSPFPVGYTYAPRSCVDCRTRGTNVRPTFWE